jgi:hypothetical protein
MDWHFASAVHRFPLQGQPFMLSQAAESRRTRRVKEGIRRFASVSAAFEPVGRIHLGNPG